MGKGQQSSDKLVVTDGWTLQDQLDEIKGKLHLKDRDLKAYYESSLNEKGKNEEAIMFQRSDNKRKRRTLADHVHHGDERVITNAFPERRHERLSLQRFTVSEALESMDQKACESAKTLNAVLHERKNREQKLVELQSALERMSLVDAVDCSDTPDDQNVRRLENALDKAKMKFDTARNISTHYEHILKQLQEESMTLPARLDAMEAALVQQREELRELREMKEKATLTRDDSKKELSIFEKTMWDAKRKRDQELVATRKEVERRKDMTGKAEKKTNRATLINDPHQDIMTHEKKGKREIQCKILSYQEAFNRIKEATGVADVAEVVDRVQTQSQAEAKLEAQKKAKQIERNQLKEELKKLEGEYHDLKFNGERKLSNGQRMLEDMQEYIVKKDEKSARTQERLQRLGDTVIGVKTGVATLLEKLKDIRPKSAQKNYVNMDVFENLDLVNKKLDNLTKELGTANADLQDTRLLDYIETKLPPDNVRINMECSDPSLTDDFGYDSQDNEEALSRDDIKKQVQQILDAKLKPKKTRRKARKK